MLSYKYNTYILLWLIHMIKKLLEMPTRWLVQWLGVRDPACQDWVRVLSIANCWWASLVGLTPHTVWLERSEPMSDRRPARGYNIAIKAPIFFNQKKKNCWRLSTQSSTYHFSIKSHRYFLL